MRALNRQRHSVEHVDTEGSWAISYGDMITLLLSFFVLYFTVDPKKSSEKKMRESLSLRLITELKEKSHLLPTPQLNMGLTEGRGIEKTVIPKVGAQVYDVGQKLIIDFPDVSFFNLGAILLTNGGIKELEKFARVFLPYSGHNRLIIQAFTDTRKVRFDTVKFRDNLELSALRAIAAMRILEKAGIPLSAMKIGGHGEMTETQERLNKLQNDRDPLRFTRRIVLTIEPKVEGA